jgi:hypothetical protein
MNAMRKMFDLSQYSGLHARLSLSLCNVPTGGGGELAVVRDGGEVEEDGGGGRVINLIAAHDMMDGFIISNGGDLTL